MAFSGLFSNKVLFVDDLYFDTHIRETHHYNARITQHPVEFGANITDNIFVNPTMFECDIMVSDTQSLVSVVSGVVAGSPFSFINRAADALQKLRQLLVNRLPLTIVTGLASYENMYLVDILGEKTSKNQSTLEATLIFQQILIAGDVSSFGGDTGGPFSGRANRGNLQPNGVPS
jgi:hypothetical protein